MKKFVSLLCCMAMLFTLCTSAFAAEPEQTSTSADVAVVNVLGGSGISPQAESKGLAYIENQQILQTGGVMNFKVTPEKGAHLRIWLKNTEGPVKVNVMYTNIIGTWSNVGDPVTYGVGERDNIFVNSCNGKPYLVQVAATDLWAIYSMLVYQN